MFNNRWALSGLVIFTLFFLVSVLEIDAWARVGGGRSFGSRGSRSYSAPRSTPAPSPASPSQGSRQYNTPSAPAPSPFGGGGFLRSMAGGTGRGDARIDALPQPRFCRRRHGRHGRRHRVHGHHPDRGAPLRNLLVHQTETRHRGRGAARGDLLPGIVSGRHRADGPADAGL